MRICLVVLDYFIKIKKKKKSQKLLYLVLSATNIAQLVLMASLLTSMDGRVRVHLVEMMEK